MPNGLRRPVAVRVFLQLGRSATTLLELDVEKLPALLEQMAKDPLSRYINLSDAAGLTLRKKDLSSGTYAAVAKVEERLLLNEYTEKGYGGKSVAAYERLADTYEKAGDSAKAVATMKKAISFAQQQKAPEEQIRKLQDTLARYKQAATKTAEL